MLLLLKVKKPRGLTAHVNYSSIITVVQISTNVSLTTAAAVQTLLVQTPSEVLIVLARADSQETA